MKLGARLRFVVSRLKAAFRKKKPNKRAAPSGYIAMYVGEEHERFLVPIACLSSVMFQALLKVFEDSLVPVDRPITLPCSPWLFEGILNLAVGKQQLLSA